MKMLFRLWNDESAATAIEYGFILALIVIGIIASVEAIGVQVATPLNTAGQTMASR
jgi:Flp pilus assembly pilin Flp